MAGMKLSKDEVDVDLRMYTQSARETVKVDLK